MKEHGGVIVGLDGNWIGVARISLLESFDAAAGLLPDGHHGNQIGAELCHFAAGNPSDKVKPVGADVGNGAQLAAEFRVKTPVPVAGIKEPVLQKAAMDQFGPTDGALLNESASFLAER